MTRTSDLAAAKACLTGLCGAEAPVLAAVSGGLDSMCLLHLLATWGREWNLKRRRPPISTTSSGARNQTGTSGSSGTGAPPMLFPFSPAGAMSGAKAEREGLSVEEAARTLRYAFLEEVRQREGFDCILTAPPCR